MVSKLRASAHLDIMTEMITTVLSSSTVQGKIRTTAEK